MVVATLRIRCAVPVSSAALVLSIAHCCQAVMTLNTALRRMAANFITVQSATLSVVVPFGFRIDN